MRLRPMRTILAVAVLATSLLAPAGAQAAAPLPVPFTAHVNGCAIFGDGVAPDRIVHRGASGAKKATYTPSSFSLSWGAYCTKPALVPGDSLTFLDLTDPENPTVVQKVTIPTFTAAADRKLKRVTGVSKGAKTVTVSLQECPASFNSCSSKDEGELTTGAGAAYTYAPAKPVTSLWQAVLKRVSAGLSLTITARFPRLVVTPGSAGVEGVANPGQSVSVRVDRAGKAATLSAKGSALRTFRGTVKRNGVARAAAAGDRVRWYLDGTIQADFTIPATDFLVGPSHTFGHCFPNSTVSLKATKPDQSESTFKAGTTDADGAFDIPTSIPSGWAMVVDCRTKAGDVVQMTGVAGG